ncbi:MFS transporter [Arthrobacter sp. JUb115]|uniref:MFS transporter n=1 Tax=Arthrobacter sp. JUb115 TaxID=2485108 RepID=UPI00106033B6|nr:MFS transporter [Arthrobacter sp. JUb115]TDU26052.1 putative MFS family arabinose efflux permease [Arthrobacter sp. JUb115]
MEKQQDLRISVRTIPDSALRFVGFLSFFDRYGTPPMLVALSLGTSLSFAQAVQLVASYALFYAIGQPIWGVLSDRFGRLAVLRAALIGAGLGAVASILFTDYLPLLIARSVTGFMFGALYPTLMTLLGDTRTGVERARGLSDLQIYSSLGTTLATLASGALATYANWRLVFLLPALGCVAALYSLRKAAEPEHSRSGFKFRAALRPMNLALYAIVFLEGGLLMGLLTYIVPALQESGVAIGLAGALGCAFALGVILGARLMRRLVARIGRTWLIGGGGLLLCAAFLPSAFAPSPASYTLTAFFLGAANAIMHSSMQGWATEISPDARATTVSLFVFALFAGASAATHLSADLAQNGHYGQISGIGLALSLLLVALATGTHALWRRMHPAS